jgi:cation:H+ antiporter
MVVVWLLAFVIGVALIVWGAEAFAEHLGAASVRLGVSAFALALLLAGAEPEELATWSWRRCVVPPASRWAM